MSTSVITLNRRRVTYANHRGRMPHYERPYFNCWGATMFVLGGADRLNWLSGWRMQQWLDQNTREIYRPRKPGDIVAVHAWGLEHTAVYIGNSKYFHKQGGNVSEITDLAGIRRTYRGAYTFLRPVAVTA